MFYVFILFAVLVVVQIGVSYLCNHVLKIPMPEFLDYPRLQIFAVTLVVQGLVIVAATLLIRE